MALQVRIIECEDGSNESVLDRKQLELNDEIIALKQKLADAKYENQNTLFAVSGFFESLDKSVHISCSDITGNHGKKL